MKATSVLRAACAPLAIAASLAIAACAPTPPAHAPRPSVAAAVDTMPDAPFRARAPEPELADFVPPRIDETRLSNGVRVLVVERRELPIASVEVVVNAGFADLEDVPEAYMLMAALLEQGTASRSAAQIADAFRALGAEHRAWSDFDSGGASAKVMSSELDAAIDLLADVVQRPAFAVDEVERARQRWTSWAKQQRLAIDRRAATALAASVYGREHPYGRTMLARPAAMARVTRDDVTRAYARQMSPARATIVVAGDVARATLVPKLEAAFGAWRAAPAAPPRAVPPAEPNGARVVLCDAPRTTEPRVMLAEPGVAFSSSDRDAVAVMNEILGGAYASRIFRNLRETHAYTYGAFSSFALRHGPGPFSAGGAFDAAHVGDAIRELFAEVNAIRDADVSPEELAAAKRHLVLALPARFEAASDLTRALATIAVHGLPLDEWSTYAARIGAVGVADVRRVARAHLHPDRMKVIVTGDRRQLTPALEQLGLGPIELRDADGAIVE